MSVNDDNFLVAVAGCIHGEIDKMYDAVAKLQHECNAKIDVVICCGDFQSIRNTADLRCMAVSDKFRHMGNFYKYYSGEKEAPIMTIFIGGNHEASNFLQELPYGGWVAPKIFYMGYSNVIRICKRNAASGRLSYIRVGGLSGIFKNNDYRMGRYERVPYTSSTMRSVYHVRNLDEFRLRQLRPPADVMSEALNSSGGRLDVMLSHDWPCSIHRFGDVDQLLRRKPFFKDDIDQNRLGSIPAWNILAHLRPSYWFSAHLHVKFAAIVNHDDGSHSKFLALDKCLPHRDFLQLVPAKCNDADADTFGCLGDDIGRIFLSYDVEWLKILADTQELSNSTASTNHMPGRGYTGRWDYTPSAEDLASAKALFFPDADYVIHEDFVTNVEPYDGVSTVHQSHMPKTPNCNPQTVDICRRFGLTDPLFPAGVKSNDAQHAQQTISRNIDEINISSSDESEQGVEAPKRPCLALPPPVNLNHDSTVDIPSATGELESVIGDDPLQARSDDEKQLSEDDSNEVDTTAAPVLKMKRRNFDIYCNTNAET